jgi:uncharacterized protein
LAKQNLKIIWSLQHIIDQDCACESFHLFSLNKGSHYLAGDCACNNIETNSQMEQNNINVFFSDCACASTSCPQISSSELVGPWHAAANVQTFPLDDGWQGLYNSNGNTSLTVLNQPAYDLLARFQTPRVIDGSNFNPGEQETLRKMASVGLLLPQESSAPYLAPRTAHAATRNSQLASWLHLTDRCNLDCAYCYLPHKREDMSRETGRAAVEATFRSAVKHDYGKVKFKYAGGEPLLRFPLLLQLHQYAQQLAEAHDLELDGVVLSNGTLLTEEIIDQLQSLGLRLMISLDGVGKWHDVQRSYVGGRGSFKDVAEAVELALAHGLVPDVSITVSGRNAAGLAETVAWVLERELPFSINFYRQNDFSAGQQDLALEEEAIITGMKAAFKVIEHNPPEYSLLASLVDRANLAVAHELTCSVGDSYIVFDQHGRVSKCQMKMDQPVADASAEDPLAFLQADQIGIQNLSVDDKEGCRDCMWQLWCTGGCPLETYRATGRYDLKSPNCNIYQAIFPEVLRLEGLRLLHHAEEIVHDAA